MFAGINKPLAGLTSALGLALFFSAGDASAATRPHYGGTLRVVVQSTPNVLELPENAAPSDYWDLTHMLGLIGDTLVQLDAQGRPVPMLAVAWQSDPAARRWQFEIRPGVKFHDGSAASPAALASILGALHPAWAVRAAGDLVVIDSETPLPSLLAELALPRNLLLKRGGTGLPLGTGPFLVAQWQAGKRLQLSANEASWAGRPFVDGVEIEFGKSLRDQRVALTLDKTDLIEMAPQAANPPGRGGPASLPVELLAMVFSVNSTADARLRQALALVIDRKPIQLVLLKGAGDPAASILPNWMTGYSGVFFEPADPQRARTLLADAGRPSLTLSYDPRDPQAQLIAERLALNAGEAGISLRVSLSGTPDLRLVRAVIPGPDPWTALDEVERQLGVAPRAMSPAGAAPRERTMNRTLDDLYQAERNLLAGYGIIPLFHLPVAGEIGPRVRGWQPDRFGGWNGVGHRLADVWLAGGRSGERLLESRPEDSE